MNILFDPLNIVLASIAIFVALKLWQVLGSRTGEENVPSPPTFKTEPKASDLVLTPVDPDLKPIWQGFADENTDLAKSLSQINAADRSFDPKSFIAGAKIAHERILEAFAKADLATLKFLLAKQVFTAFETEVNRRKQMGEIAVFKFVGVNSAKIISANLQGKTAMVNIEFVTQMISAIKDKAGVTLHGNDAIIDEVKELWSFERDVNSRDPNWKLAETHDHD
jgi:predicted lipid-binding transport protein (Tim44 family)